MNGIQNDNHDNVAEIIVMMGDGNTNPTTTTDTRPPSLVEGHQQRRSSSSASSSSCGGGHGGGDGPSTSSNNNINNNASSSTLKTGRKGDPRMHRAVAARLADGKISLFEALAIGGFEYTSDDDPNAMDSENVSLAQRKNQLSRRVRLARKHHSDDDHHHPQQQQPPNFLFGAERLIMGNNNSGNPVEAVASGGAGYGANSGRTGSKRHFQPPEDDGLDDDPAVCLTETDNTTSTTNNNQVRADNGNDYDQMQGERLQWAKHHPDFHPILVGQPGRGAQLMATGASGGGGSSATVDDLLFMNQAYQQLSGFTPTAGFPSLQQQGRVASNNTMPSFAAALMHPAQYNGSSIAPELVDLLAPRHDENNNNNRDGTAPVAASMTAPYSSLPTHNYLSGGGGSGASGRLPSVPSNKNRAAAAAQLNQAPTPAAGRGAGGGLPPTRSMAMDGTFRSGPTATISRQPHPPHQGERASLHPSIQQPQQQPSMAHSGVAIASLAQTAASVGMTLEQLALTLRNGNTLARVLLPSANSAQAQQNLAIALYQNESRALYSRSMLMAGFDPEIAQDEQSEQYIQVALAAWEREGQRLQSLMSSSNPAADAEPPLEANTPPSPPGGSAGSGRDPHLGGGGGGGPIMFQSEQQESQQQRPASGGSHHHHQHEHHSHDHPGGECAFEGGRHIHRLEGRCGHKAILHQPPNGAAHIDFVVGDRVECYQGVEPKSNDSTIKVWPSNYKCEELRCNNKCTDPTLAGSAKSHKHSRLGCVVMTDPKILDMDEIDLEGDEWNSDFANEETLLAMFKLGEGSLRKRNSDASLASIESASSCSQQHCNNHVSHSKTERKKTKETVLGRDIGTKL
jgi:hypothetical protein